MNIAVQKKFPWISYRVVYLLLPLLVFSLWACAPKKDGRQKPVAPEVISTNESASGFPISVEFTAGPAHNHPLMAIWLADTAGNYLETLYIASSIGTGIFKHGQANDGRWAPGPVQRPAALPYWWHGYGSLPTPQDPAPDAVTRATPATDFVLNTRTLKNYEGAFDILLEINQPWDWNEYWTNDKFPGNDEYMTSSQPALVYRARIPAIAKSGEYLMKLAGHSHYAGENGLLYGNTNTITTAKKIAGSIRVRIGDEAQ